MTIFGKIAVALTGGLLGVGVVSAAVAYRRKKSEKNPKESKKDSKKA